MLTRVDTTMSGGSPINPIHVHGMATAGGPPVTLTPLASPMQRDAVKRCEIMGSGDGMIMYVIVMSHSDESCMIMYVTSLTSLKGDC